MRGRFLIKPITFIDTPGFQQSLCILLSSLRSHDLSIWCDTMIKRIKRQLLVFSRYTYYNLGHYVDLLQFQRYFIPQAEMEEAFIYNS